MTAPRIPRSTPMWRDTAPAVQMTRPAELDDPPIAADAPAAQCNQACPPCNGDCQQGRECPADAPQGAGDWSMVAFWLSLLCLPVLWRFTFGAAL